MSDKRVMPSEEDFKALVRSKVGTDAAPAATANDIVMAEEPWLPTDKLPGFDKLTFQLCQVYEIRWAQIEIFLEAKQKGFQATLVHTPVGSHVVRGFTRTEWARMQRKIAEEAEARAKTHAEAKANPNWAEKDIEMHTEELIAIEATMLPRYQTTVELRARPAGVAAMLSEAILEASALIGAQNLPPIRL